MTGFDCKKKMHAVETAILFEYNERNNSDVPNEKLVR